MKALAPIATLAIAVLLSSCRQPTQDVEVQFPENATVLRVEGMQCSQCKATLMRALSEVEGVEWAQVENELGKVAYSGPATKTDVIAAIRAKGYQVEE